MTSDIEKLQAHIAELQAMDLDKIRARMVLLNARINLEDHAKALADELDVERETVLLTMRAVWTVRIDRDDVDAVSPEEFVARVEADTRTVLDALANGEHSTGVHDLDVMLSQTIDLGREGGEIKTTRESFEAFGGLISKMRGCSDC